MLLRLIWQVTTRCILARCILVGITFGAGLTPLASSAQATDISSTYQWKPVKIGGGGWVVGMVIHPLDPTVRYTRTDVGNAYRWDVPTQQWLPMRVSNSDGSGVQSAAETSAPSSFGESSVNVDPNNRLVVFMVFPTEHSCDVQCPTNYEEIYKSVDGGMNFTPGNMTAAAIVGNPNGTNRMYGERLAVDPANSSVLYFGSETQGLFRSVDGGMTWAQMASGLPVNVEFINIQFAKAPGTVTANGVQLSKTVYAVSINNSGDAGGDVYQSQDGGQTWTDISTGVKDAASGQSWAHQALSSSIDPTDTVYVAENSATNGGLRAYWRYSAGAWTRFSLQSGGVNLINQAVVSVVADPTNPLRIYALGADTSLARSDNGGASSINLGAPVYANTLGWLPQTVGMAGGEWHSNGGLKIDSAGNLWTPTGQEGPLTIAAATASAATQASPPKWTIVTNGIEELVAEEMIVPPGSGDTLIVSAMDTTGFTIPNPDNFSAVQIPLQQEIISQGTSVSYSPDAPSYIAITSSNVYTNGKNYSGYSADGGLTWKAFGPALQWTCGTSKCDIPSGMIAVSARGSRTLGNDHIVIYPPENLAPQYSQDGGATWHVTASFPLNADGMTIGGSSYSSFLYPQISERTLRADPFTADRFYLKLTHAPASFYVSSDSGQTWVAQPNANLPDWTWNGQLAVNSKVQNDLWFVDGVAGATVHGLFHSTDGGATFQQIAGISHAITLAAGAGSGQPGDAPYAVYFYGQLSTDPAWGVFRSTNAGASWDRVAYYPLGVYITPNSMAASQDTFGKVYIGLGGESFVYGQIVGSGSVLPGVPANLSATAKSNAEIDLAWTAAGGTVTGYNILRGTSAGGESATPVANGVSATTYADTSVTQGATYYYKVAAANSAGQGPLSNESSAVALTPSVAIALAAGASATATVQAGQTASYSLVLNSINYAGTVTFTCAGAPAGYTCIVPAPATLTTATATTAVTISVQTPSTIAAVHNGQPVRFALSLGLLLLPLVLVGKRPAWVALVVLAVVGMFAMNGCGSSVGSSGGGGSSSTPVTSTLTISAASAGLTTVSQQLTLTVQ
jgi:hypothetical protein